MKDVVDEMIQVAKVGLRTSAQTVVQRKAYSYAGMAYRETDL